MISPTIPSVRTSLPFPVSHAFLRGRGFPVAAGRHGRWMGRPQAEAPRLGAANQAAEEGVPSKRGTQSQSS